MSISFTDPRWGPLTPSAHLKGSIEQDGKRLTAETVGGTDWWRTTERDSKDGPTLGFNFGRAGRQGFEISVEVGVEPKTQADQSDQAGIFLHAGPKRWVKAGLEFDNGKLWNAVVVCNPYSDWSLFPRQPTDSARFTLVVRPHGVDVYLGNDMVREVKWFGPTKDGDADPSAETAEDVFVGIMACSPIKGGAAVSFTDFTLKEGARVK